MLLLLWINGFSFILKIIILWNEILLWNIIVIIFSVKKFLFAKRFANKDEIIVKSYEKDRNQASLESRNLEEELRIAENNLVAKIESQKARGLSINQDTRAATKSLEEIRSKSKEYENAIMEGINCTIGK